MDFSSWFNGLVVGLASGVLLSLPFFIRLLLKRKKAEIFVKHIENHLKNDEEFKGLDNGKEVMCKICDKTIDEIYEEVLKNVKTENS